MPQPTRQARLGRAIRAIRLSQGLTQEDLAGRVDMHPTYLSDIERGVRNPGWDAVARLAEGLRVPVAEIAAEYDRPSA